MTDYKTDLDNALKRANKLRHALQSTQETIKYLRRKVRIPIDIAYIDGETEKITIRLTRELMKDYNLRNIVFNSHVDPSTLDTIVTLENAEEKPQ